MKLKPVWPPYSKKFCSLLSTDKKAKSPSMAPKTTHDLTLSYHFPAFPITTLKNPILQQAIHNSLDILGSLLFFLCFCAYCHLRTDDTLNLHYAKGLLSSKDQVNTFLSMKAAWKAPISLCECGSRCQCPHCRGSLFKPKMLKQVIFCTSGATGSVWRHFYLSKLRVWGI